MMKKVILFNPENSGRGIKVDDSSIRNIKMLKPPFGLLTIAACFLKNAVDVVWVDADVLRNSPEQVNQLIRGNLDADLIAAGGLHTTYSSVKKLFKFLQAEKIDIPVLLGGRIAQTLDYLLWEKIPNLKMICRQEGEHVIDSLCEHFPDIENVLGIEYRKNGKIVKNPAAPIVESLDEIPPLPWRLLDRLYFTRRTGNILTGRGCPYACNFCQVTGKKYRCISISKTLGEVRQLIETYNLRTIVVMDEFFLQNKQRVREFCDGVKDLNIRWRCTGRANLIKENDYELLRKMAKSGCKKILIGIESANQKILDNMNKQVKVNTIENTVNLIRKVGMKVSAGFIFGYPGETWETAMETVNWRIKMGLRWGYYYATPYPGSKLYLDFIQRFNLTLDQEEDWIANSPGIKELKVNMTDMSMEELKELDRACRTKLQEENHRMLDIYLGLKNKTRRIYLYMAQKLFDK